MTAIKTTNLVEGNLAAEPKYFPKGQYAARLIFRILHTDRRFNADTNQWEDGRTTAIEINFHDAAADRIAQTIQRQPGLYAKGTAVVAWGDIADRPNAYIDKDGNAQAVTVINGRRIIPDQPVNQRRAQARTTSPQPTQPAGQTQADGFASPVDDPWDNQQDDTFASPLGEPAI